MKRNFQGEAGNYVLPKDAIMWLLSGLIYRLVDIFPIYSSHPSVL